MAVLINRGQAAVVKVFNTVFLSFRLNFAIFTSQKATRGYSGYCSPDRERERPFRQIGSNAVLELVSAGPSLKPFWRVDYGNVGLSLTFDGISL